ncbi:MAG: hypothetical protein AB7S53_04025 [Thiomonas sp.]
MSPTLEIHVPISPTPAFFRQLWALAASVRQFGGQVGRSASITAWVSPELPGLPDLHRLHPWARRLGVSFRWVDAGLFAWHWYFGTALARWSGHFKADVVLMLDADVVIIRALDDLAADVLARPGLHGLLTHISPLTEAQWQTLWQGTGLGDAPLECTPLAVDFMTFTKAQRMPPYFNLGVLAAPADVMRLLGEGLVEEMERANALEKNWFRCQIAVAMSRARHGLPWFALPLRDNFPNIEGFEQRQPQELAAMRIAHYLNKTATWDKSRDFNDRAAYAALLHRPGLAGTEAVVQRVLRSLPACPLDAWPQRLRTRWLHPQAELASGDGYL